MRTFGLCSGPCVGLRCAQPNLRAQKEDHTMLPNIKRRLLTLLLLAAALPMVAQAEDALRFGVGLFQPDKEKNDATYRPMTDYLAKKLGRKVELRTVDSWEGLAKSLANGETDIALLGPWGYVLANQHSGAQA